MSKKGKGNDPKPEDGTTKKTTKEEGMVMEGVVVEALRGKFRVQIVPEGAEYDPDDDKPKHEVLAHLAGKLRQNWIKIVPGDKVNVEISPYDITRGRITYRLKK